MTKKHKIVKLQHMRYSLPLKYLGCFGLDDHFSPCGAASLRIAVAHAVMLAFQETVLRASPRVSSLTRGNTV